MITRFAPSPTGPLHLGHAFSACLAHDAARAAGGRFHLRLDDIDQSRARSHWAAQIEDDLSWLGLTWDGPVWRQSGRLERYQSGLDQLWDLGLLYPCTCSRADIKAAASAPQDGAPLTGPDGIIYPGTCKSEPKGPRPRDQALRINMNKAMQNIDNISFSEGQITAPEMIRTIGDVVLARKDMGASYHLSIVLDDADQNITHVIRGEDLREATFIHVLLQKLLGLPTPHYHHHSLIRDAAGKRLAKRDDARALATYRAEGLTPDDIRGLLPLAKNTSGELAAGQGGSAP